MRRYWESHLLLGAWLCAVVFGCGGGIPIAVRLSQGTQSTETFHHPEITCTKQSNGKYTFKLFDSGPFNIVVTHPDGTSNQYNGNSQGPVGDVEIGPGDKVTFNFNTAIPKVIKVT